ncbi:hypothetical protein ACPTJS_16155, partial [Enterococcus faecalis]|uniref:hypothetical protein n=1 Tax=Enterococcus faecalis TaxID=1351 RepID=UPI003CC5A207
PHPPPTPPRGADLGQTVILSAQLVNMEMNSPLQITFETKEPKRNIRSFYQQNILHYLTNEDILALDSPQSLLRGCSFV